jgi:hypothetical protein
MNSGWGLTKPAPLDQVAVLSQPVGMPIDNSSPPSLAPDHRDARGSAWQNIGRMCDDPG